MTLTDVRNLANNTNFLYAIQSAIVHAAIAVLSEALNEVQTITFGGTVSGGTYTITALGQTTAAIPWNSSAGAVHAALGALSNIGLANVAVTGGPGPGTPMQINFVGALAGAPQTLSTTTSSLTGTSPTVTITRTTAGAVGAVNHAQRAALASKILANPTGYAELMAPGVADSTTVQTDYPAPNFTLAGGVTQAQADADVNNQASAIFNAYT